MNIYDGYTESAEQTEARYQRMQAWKEQIDLCSAIVAENEPEIMRIRYAVAGAFIVPLEVKPTPAPLTSRMESACSLLLAEIDEKRQFAVAALETLRNTPAANPTMEKTIHMTDDTRGVYDMTPIESDMPSDFDFDGVKEVEF